MNLGCWLQVACSLVEDVQGTGRDQRIKEETEGTLWMYHHCLWLRELHPAMYFFSTHTLKIAGLNKVTIIIHISPQSRTKEKKDQFSREEKHGKGEGLVAETHHSNIETPSFLVFPSKCSVFRTLIAPKRSLYFETWILELPIFLFPPKTVGNLRNSRKLASQRTWLSASFYLVYRIRWAYLWTILHTKKICVKY